MSSFMTRRRFITLAPIAAASLFVFPNIGVSLESKGADNFTIAETAFGKLH